MNNIKLSVIIPVYNAAAHLPGMFEMLARQSDKDFEVVFVNDGSKDDSLDILSRECESARFSAHIVDQPNAGAAAARNAGIDAAKGEYVTFVDADDAITDDFVREYIAGAARGGVTVYRHSRVVGGEPRFDTGDGSVSRRDPEEVLRMLMLNPTGFGVYDIVVDREFLVSSGVRFPDGYPYYEDYDFLLRLFNAADAIKMADMCNYCYKAAPGSAMNTFNKERLRCLQLFDNIHSLYFCNRPLFHTDFAKWFAPRLRWSVLWQACVSMPVGRALRFCGGVETRRAMRSLLDHPDRRVALSAAVYLVCPPLFAIIMRRMGKRRTLLPAD